MNDNKNNASVPYFIHEGDMVRVERGKKRLVVALIISMAVTAMAILGVLYNNHMWMEYAKTIETYQSTNQ